MDLDNIYFSDLEEIQKYLAKHYDRFNMNDILDCDFIFKHLFRFSAYQLLEKIFEQLNKDILGHVFLNIYEMLLITENLEGLIFLIKYDHQYYLKENLKHLFYDDHSEDFLRKFLNSDLDLTNINIELDDYITNKHIHPNLPIIFEFHTRFNLNLEDLLIFAAQHGLITLLQNYLNKFHNFSEKIYAFLRVAIENKQIEIMKFLLPKLANNEILIEPLSQLFENLLSNSNIKNDEVLAVLKITTEIILENSNLEKLLLETTNLQNVEITLHILEFFKKYHQIFNPKLLSYYEKALYGSIFKTKLFKINYKYLEFNQDSEMIYNLMIYLIAINEYQTDHIFLFLLEAEKKKIVEEKNPGQSLLKILPLNIFEKICQDNLPLLNRLFEIHHLYRINEYQPLINSYSAQILSYLCQHLPEMTDKDLLYNLLEIIDVENFNIKQFNYDLKDLPREIFLIFLHKKLISAEDFTEKYINHLLEHGEIYLLTILKSFKYLDVLKQMKINYCSLINRGNYSSVEWLIKKGYFRKEDVDEELKFLILSVDFDFLKLLNNNNIIKPTDFKVKDQEVENVSPKKIGYYYNLGIIELSEEYIIKMIYDDNLELIKVLMSEKIIKIGEGEMILKVIITEMDTYGNMSIVELKYIHIELAKLKKEEISLAMEKILKLPLFDLDLALVEERYEDVMHKLKIKNEIIVEGVKLGIV